MCPQMKTIKELAEETGISYSRIRKWCLDGTIVYVKAGTRYLVNVEKFKEFLNGETEEREQQGRE